MRISDDVARTAYDELAQLHTATTRGNDLNIDRCMECGREFPCDSAELLKVIPPPVAVEGLITAVAALRAYVADQWASGEGDADELGEPRDGYRRYDEKMADLREDIAYAAEQMIPE